MNEATLDLDSIMHLIVVEVKLSISCKSDKPVMEKYHVYEDSPKLSGEEESVQLNTNVVYGVATNTSHNEERVYEN